MSHGEDSGIIQTVDFDYTTVEKSVFGKDPESELGGYTQEEIDRALEVLTKILEWIWQGGMQNTEGILIRSVIACWIFLKQNRPLTLTHVANGLGKDKQSLGRWHDDFKAAFPMIKTAHMRHE